MPGATVRSVHVPSTGASNGTFLCAVDVSGSDSRDLVLRLQPTENQFLDPDVLFQARVMRALAAHSRVPVPRVLWDVPDIEVLGTPFLVMDRVPGAVLPDAHHSEGWALDLEPAQRTALYEATLDVFVALHTTPVTEPLHFLRRPGLGTPAERHMQWLLRWHEWAARGRRLELIDDGLAWVLAHCPDDDGEAVLWGDARPGNMLFASDMSVAAAVDWELAATGPAESDLGWWLMFEESQTVARGVAPLPGVPTHDEIVARYEAGIGRSTRDVGYWKVVAALQFAIILRRYWDMQIVAGRMPPGSAPPVESPPMRLLAAGIGASPLGSTTAAETVTHRAAAQ